MNKNLPQVVNKGRLGWQVIWPKGWISSVPNEEAATLIVNAAKDYKALCALAASVQAAWDNASGNEYNDTILCSEDSQKVRAALDGLNAARNEGK